MSYIKILKEIGYFYFTLQTRAHSFSQWRKPFNEQEKKGQYKHRFAVQLKLAYNYTKDLNSLPILLFEKERQKKYKTNKQTKT